AATLRSPRADPRLEPHLPQRARVAPIRSRGRRLQLALVAGRSALGAELSPQVRRRARGRGLELHTGAAARLSRGRADRRALSRDIQLRLQLLRRLERRQRLGGDGARAVHGPAALDRAVAAAARRHPARAGLSLARPTSDYTTAMSQRSPQS